MDLAVGEWVAVISLLVTIVGLIIAYLAWKQPTAPDNAGTTSETPHENVEMRGVNVSGTKGNVTINTSGLSGEEVKALMDESKEKELGALSSKLGVHEMALLNFFNILGKSQVPTERLGVELDNIAHQHHDTLKRLDQYIQNGQGVTDLFQQAQGKVTEGQYNSARELYEKIQQQGQLQAAQAAFEIGSIYDIEFCHLESAQAFEEAYQLLPKDEGTQNLQVEYLLAWGGVLSRYSTYTNDGTALDKAQKVLTLYENALAITSRENSPKRWAKVQCHLGKAFFALSCKCQDNNAYVKQAITAYEKALQEITRQQAPLDWGDIQLGLGNVFSCSEQEVRAIKCYENALLVWPRDQAPLRWVTIQNNLGNALRNLGKRECSSEYLSKALIAYRSALLEQSRDQSPLKWAASQHNLGLTLKTLGELEGRSTDLEQALAAFEEALLERKREKVPMYWAHTQRALGATLHLLGERRQDTEILQQALMAFNSAKDCFFEAKEMRSQKSIDEDIQVTQRVITELHNELVR